VKTVAVIDTNNFCKLTLKLLIQGIGYSWNVTVSVVKVAARTFSD